mmetsp:Transcript_7956/g.16580  ORF Transcript_7956/g.16580 Transcript_7956/m.16580 type:complete len:310 (-) Transcript_7956:2758-3687(-)
MTTDPSFQLAAKMKLMEPDGYYKYMGVERKVVEAATPESSSNSAPQNSSSAYVVDEVAVKKAYRKLSLKHHPDKGGDVDTFRLLTRANKVLTNPKLRAQYDNLGIDLDDDNVNENGANDETDAPNQNDGGISQGIVSELASLALTSIIQLAIRTMLMGAVAVLVVRYRLLFYPAVLFMLYAVVSVVGKAATRGGSVYDTGAQYIDALSPGLIMLGLWFMSYGRSSTTTTGENGEEEQKVVEWTWLFWLGESIVIALFSYNSITTIPWNVVSLSLLGVAGGLLALWFRGSFFNYLVVSCCHCAFSTMHRS